MKEYAQSPCVQEPYQGCIALHGAYLRILLPISNAHSPRLNALNQYVVCAAMQYLCECRGAWDGTCSVMQVLLGFTGRTYCRECISGWLAGHNTSPHDNTHLTSRQLVTNWDMRGMVEAYHARQVRMSDIACEVHARCRCLRYPHLSLFDKH